MKLIALLLLIAANLHCLAADDVRSLADSVAQLTARWKTTKIERLEGNSFPTVITGMELAIERNGTANLTAITDSGEKMPRPTRVLIGIKELVFYSDADQADAVGVWQWEVRDGTLILTSRDPAGGTLRLTMKKVEQAGAGQPATRTESDSEGGDKP